MSIAHGMRPAQWREVIVQSVAKAIFTAVLAAYLLSTSLLDRERSAW